MAAAPHPPNQSGEVQFPANSLMRLPCQVLIEDQHVEGRV